MLAEYTQGIPVRTFSYDGAGRMIEATVFTLTTRFTYNGLGARLAVEVVGHGTTTYTLDYAAGNRVLVEATSDGSVHYLYGHDCLGELRDDSWLYYLNDATGYVRQGADEQGEVVSGWLFDPDGTLLEGPEGPVSHLICGGVYDWSTGLIHEDGRYFDPMLGIWLALMPLVVVESWKGRKRKRRGFPWYVLLVLFIGMSGVLTGCGEPPPSTPTPPGDTPEPTPCPVPPTPTSTPGPPTPTPEYPPPFGPVPTPEIEWLEDEFIITHYTFALESDPVYANDAKVSANGLPPENQYREGFLYGVYGVTQQGTGLTEDGQYITIDWNQGDPEGTHEQVYFTYGVGGRYANPVAWATVATGDSRLTEGTQIVIEIYQDKGAFTIADTGGGVGAGHIDVFVGAITIDEALELGNKTSRVGIIKL